ncbi:Esa1p-associated factor [Knufia peltigerae]|uniref:Chromatin modification-related protein EAF3 n=1 Tax=Knufia peltigerae TaxID=1002370 RepID=A0AA39D0H0_9EURO|nr:Esa1p-associated factor [Knufia peltigerae]
MAPQSSETKPMYQKDEKALCFHGELLYEAKVLEVRRVDPKDKTSAHEYRVHYKGWKNTWDDWVPQDRLRKLTDDNRELAANLRREATAAVTKAPPKSTGKTRRGQGSEFGSGRGSEERTSSVPAGGRGTKRARDNDIEKMDDNPANNDGKAAVQRKKRRDPVLSDNPNLDLVAYVPRRAAVQATSRLLGHTKPSVPATKPASRKAPAPGNSPAPAKTSGPVKASGPTKMTTPNKRSTSQVRTRSSTKLDKNASTTTKRAETSYHQRQAPIPINSSATGFNNAETQASKALKENRAGRVTKFRASSNTSTGFVGNYHTYVDETPIMPDDRETPKLPPFRPELKRTLQVDESDDDGLINETKKERRIVDDFIRAVRMERGPAPPLPPARTSAAASDATISDVDSDATITDPEDQNPPEEVLSKPSTQYPIFDDRRTSSTGSARRDLQFAGRELRPRHKFEHSSRRAPTPMASLAGSPNFGPPPVPQVAAPLNRGNPLSSPMDRPKPRYPRTSLWAPHGRY